jgi:hypothetical protein
MTCDSLQHSKHALPIGILPGGPIATVVVAANAAAAFADFPAAAGGDTDLFATAARDLPPAAAQLLVVLAQKAGQPHRAEAAARHAAMAEPGHAAALAMHLEHSEQPRQRPRGDVRPSVEWCSGQGGDRVASSQVPASQVMAPPLLAAYVSSCSGNSPPVDQAAELLLLPARSSPVICRAWQCSHFVRVAVSLYVWACHTHRTHRRSHHHCGQHISSSSRSRSRSSSSSTSSSSSSSRSRSLLFAAAGASCCTA